MRPLKDIAEVMIEAEDLETYAPGALHRMTVRKVTAWRDGGASGPGERVENHCDGAEIWGTT
jgi:hypothetical protein